MSKIYLPATNAEQWSLFLAEPHKHWRKGFSARSLAYSWQEAEGFPSEIHALFVETAPFCDIELLLALPEHQVALPGGSRPSQSDVWALARAAGKLVSITVEGKVMEPFGPTMDEWLAEASAGKDARLAYLCAQLGLSVPLPGDMRYQLLHRAASAVIEARRFTASHAVMLVHSFSQTDEWFSDFAAFVLLFGSQAAVGKLVSARSASDVTLHFGWVRGNPAYLAK